MENNRLILFFFIFILAVSTVKAQESKDSDKIKSGTWNEVLFVENKGQLYDQDFKSVSDVKFYGSIQGLFYHLKSNGVNFQQFQMDGGQSGINEENEFTDLEARSGLIYRTEMVFKGSNENVNIVSELQNQDLKNYYLAHCPNGIIGVASFKRIRFENIYKGIDVTWYGNEGSLEYDFNLSPYADYHMIQIEVKGAEEIYINDESSLVITTPLGSISQAPPTVFQSGRELPSRWVINGDVVSFEIDQYDPQISMVIDPIVRQWGTYFGGLKGEVFQSVEQYGNHVVMTGLSESLTLVATTGVHQTVHGGKTDALISKFDDTGALIWSTYFGGSDDDHARSLATDGSAIYITGQTYSSSGITTVGSHQTTLGGFYDGFLAKFSFANGSRTWATYYGGTGHDEMMAVAMAGNNIYITGFSSSNSAISTPGSFQAIPSALGDAFLVKFNPSGQRIWGTYYGGNGSESAHSCAAFGNDVYMFGYTFSTTGIATSGAHQTSLASTGYSDAFLVKFNSNGSRQWATYFGGTDREEPMSCIADADNVYLTGMTKSNSGISTSGSHQVSYGGNTDLFITKFSNAGSLIWSTYYGGNERELISYQSSHTITMHEDKLAVAAQTKSSNSIATVDAHQTSFGGNADGFVALFDTNGTRKWATYYGGTGYETVHAASIGDFDMYLVGNTTSSSGIATMGSHQPNIIKTSGYPGDAFLIKFDIPCDNGDTIDVEACFNYQSPSGRYTWTASGAYLDTLTNRLGCDSVILVNLTIFGSVPVVNLGRDTTICIGNELKLDAGADGLYYLWQDQSTDRFNTATASGLYWAQVKNACGVNSDTIVISVRHAPNVFLGEDSTLCIDQTITLDAYTEDADYLWQDGSDGRYYIVTNSGEYWVDVTNPCGQDNDSILALYIEAPLVELGNDTLIYCPEVLILKVEAEEATYFWNDGSRAAFKKIKRTGNYSVQVKNKCGQDLDEIRVEVKECPCELYIPNSFTPNGDDLNDVFEIGLACEVVSFEIVILNRWGDPVFESNDENFFWDGKGLTDQEVPQGAYAYKISLNYRVESEIFHTKKQGLVYVLK